MVEAPSGEEITLAYVDLSLSDSEDAELFDSFLGRACRCAVSKAAGIEANLSIANMDFAESADAVAADGILLRLRGCRVEAAIRSLPADAFGT